MKTVKILSHKGYMGAVADLENGTFENTGAPMYRVNIEEVQITESAKEILKNARKESVGTPDVIILSDYTISMSNIAKNFMGNDISVNADADMDIIDLIEVITDEAADIDLDFVEYVNEIAPGEYTEPVIETPATETEKIVVEDFTNTDTNLPEEGNIPVSNPPSENVAEVPTAPIPAMEDINPEPQVQTEPVQDNVTDPSVQ